MLLEAIDRLGPYVFLATVTPDSRPHVTPIHANWYDGSLYAAIGKESVKGRNLSLNPAVCLHYAVSRDTGWDGLMVWGTAELLDSVADKRRLWTGVLDYDLDLFYEGGPDGSSDIAFLRVRPERAVLFLEFGFKGRLEWRPAT